MIREHRQQGSIALVVTATALLGLCAILWIIGTVPSGGPDEPAHIVRAAALVRGDLDGERVEDIGVGFEVPAWVGYPNRGCFSLVGEQPATCATDEPRPTGDALLVSSSLKYPIWGHIAPGVATFLPASIGYQFARVFDAAIPVALFVAGLALAARRGRLTLGAAALAITPMAWFSVIVVNPSGLVIAGGFALWAGMLSSERLVSGMSDRLVAWSIAAGWAAAVLPRRDGMIWAALIVAICAAAGLVDLRKLWTRLGVGPAAVIVASTLATLGWAVASDSVSSKALLLTPLLPPLGVVVHHVWSRSSTIGRRIAIVATIVAAFVVAGIGAVVTRPGGFDEALFERVLSQTGINFEEAIGLLGWLDTPLPRAVLFAWWIALGVLLGVSLLRGGRRAIAVAAATVAVGIACSWILELSQSSDTGTYWQGRYYLPLLIGVPMVLVWSRSWADTGVGEVLERREWTIGSAVLATALVVLTLAFAASMRRWAVGTAGSHRPWAWDTYGTAVPPWVLLVVHAVACVGLYVVATRAVSSVGTTRSPVPVAGRGR